MVQERRELELCRQGWDHLYYRSHKMRNNLLLVASLPDPIAIGI